MNHYEIISTQYRFGRIYPHLMEEHMPKDIGRIVQFLKLEHGMDIDGIYLENYKSPEVVVVMKGLLPMTAIRDRFANMRGIRFGEHTVISDSTFSSLEGSAL